MTNFDYLTLLEEEEMSEFLKLVYYTGVANALANEVGDDFIWSPEWFEKKYDSRKFWKEDLIEQ